MSCSVGRATGSGPLPKERREMRTVLALLAGIALMAVGAAAQTSPVARREVGSLVLENIPPVPPSLKESLRRWENVRSAAFEDWLADGSMLISTRFGATAQLHRVAFPRRRSPAGYLLRRADQRRGRPTGLRRPLPLPARCRRRRVLQCLFRRPDGRPAPDHPGWHAQSGAGLLARRQDRRLGVGEQGRAGLRHRHLAARRARRAQSPSRATERSIPSPFRRTAGRSFSAI